jgi:hypothetical protein
MDGKEKQGREGMIQLSSIRENPRNPRTITESALAKLCESIKRDPEFMVLRPIVTDETGVILGGNQRFKACLFLGMTEVPATWIRSGNFTPEQKKRFILVDNAPEGMAGDWDSVILAEDYELPELEEIGIDLESLGQFSVGEVAPPELADGDRAPFQQMTFTLHDEQAETVKEAIAKAKSEGHGESAVNENSNGNALAWIAEVFCRG